MEAFGRLGEDDRRAAVDILNRRLAGIERRKIVDSLERRGRGRRATVEQLVLDAERLPTRGRRRKTLPDEDLAEFIVDRCGVDLLESKEIKYYLVLNATHEQRERLKEHATGLMVKGSVRVQAEKLAGRSWHPGKSWARHFVRDLELPLVFAGLPGVRSEPSMLQVVPFVPLDDLTDFQADLRNQAVEVLNGQPGGNRGVLTMPTGAGKTRTAVESLIAWWLERSDRPIVLWIAQSEELCEQAVQSFSEVWTDLGHRSNVRSNLEIARFWGNAKIPEESNILVASIQKLQAAVRDPESKQALEFGELAQGIGAVVVDEAHRVGAPSYREVLDFLKIDTSRSGQSETPLLGLTATPYRGNDPETQDMAGVFHKRLLRADSLGDDPIKELRSRGVLSVAKHEVLEHAASPFDMAHNQKFVEHFEQFHDFHTGFLQEIGESELRNKALFDRLMKIPEECPTLFFGCTVEHAEAMSILLRRKGRSAEVITGDTRSATRRALIEEFRAGNISVLCNFGVLTTGFDAPRIRALVIGRPTTSRVLYAQMIGRGMRGRAFRGTEECLVVDVRDNIRFHRAGELAYNKYTEFYRDQERTW
ncbi:DEAD/DEAH box helicase [Nonomuraea sp. NPDC003804]|uniref:DEAD/DEAH box helicase n=1 Tax=Nonomuraea sp. NPDC003804 TaxID=3154547 RepID=UPI0033A223FF